MPLLSLMPALVLACGQAPPAPATPPPPLPDLDLAPGRGAPVIRLLDRLDQARLELSPGNLPPGAEAALQIPLDAGWQEAEWGEGVVWEHTLPLALAGAQHPLQPPGLALRRGEEALPYDAGLVKGPRRAGQWLVHQGSLYLVSATDPALAPPTLEREALARLEADLNPGPDGRPRVEQARQELSLGTRTHPCLYLPAPSSAEWEIQVPGQGARLRAAVGMASSPWQEGPAEARLRVQVGDRVLGQTEVRSGEGWTDLSWDLSAFAGQAQRLRLESLPMGDPSRDYLCLATPEITTTVPDADPLRIVLIGIDTLRADHLGVNGYPRPTSPALDAFARQSLRFDRTWAPAPRTRPSFRTALTGRWPWSALSAPGIAELLRARGLQTAGVVANVHLVPWLGFARGFDHWEYDNGAPAQVQVDRGLVWLQAHADQDSLLFLHLMDPHVFYLPPAPWRDRFVLDDQGLPLERGDLPDRFNRWSVQGWMDEGTLTDAQKAFITGRYDGEIAYLDQALGPFFAALDALPGRTLTVVLSDHGEELWDHGGFEHNHSLYEELTRAVLWVRPPGGLAEGGRSLRPAASLADLAPTLFEALGLPEAERPPSDGFSLWPLIDGGEAPRAAATQAALDGRPLHLGYLMFDTERWGVVARGPDGVLGKYILQTASGQEELYDLEADPGERRDLAGKVELGPWREALATATGWPVGQGWRLRLQEVEAPFVLRFAEPVLEAGVIDPEAEQRRRANLEWGEVPEALPQDVAALVLSEDRRSLAVTPGPRRQGRLWVLGPAPEAQALLVDAQGRQQVLRPGQVSLGGGRIELQPGTVIVPRQDEAHALDAARQASGATAEQLQSLRALGYLGDG